MMENITYIWVEDLNSMGINVDGSLVKTNDEGREYVLVKDVNPDISLHKRLSRSEALRIEREKIRKQLESMSEPTELELIEEGRISHPYYQLSQRLGYIDSEINS